jgi:hypothetical protein
MEWRNGIRIQPSRANRKQVGELLSGGVQPVRAVIRALPLRQTNQKRSTVQAGAAVSISAKAAWWIGKPDLEGRLQRALHSVPIASVSVKGVSPNLCPYRAFAN